VFENRVLRRIFGPRRDEVTGGWRKLHLYSLSCTILIIWLRVITWVRHVGQMGEKAVHIGFWWESQREKDH
jgi:hypothetical protein